VAFFSNLPAGITCELYGHILRVFFGMSRAG
jgi:hypothetical protein